MEAFASALVIAMVAEMRVKLHNVDRRLGAVEKSSLLPKITGAVVFFGYVFLVPH